MRAKLEELVADPAVKVTTLETRGPTASPPPLTPAILAPIEKLAAEFWPGVPVVPILQAGATDGEFTNAAGIPTYGIEPVFVGPDLGHIHGLNEYVGVKSLLEGPRVSLSPGQDLRGAEVAGHAAVPYALLARARPGCRERSPR